MHYVLVSSGIRLRASRITSPTRLPGTPIARLTCPSSPGSTTCRCPTNEHVVILGAGFGGLELAARLSAALPERLTITLIDHNKGFTFGFSKLEVLYGRQTPAEVEISYDAVAMPGVEFRREHITAIDPAARRVVTDAGTYDADILVVALGADYDHAATPGFVDAGFEFYTVAGAQRLFERLETFDGGDVLLAILGVPFKCPPAPYEAALLLHDHLVAKGVRDGDQPSS